MTSVHEHSAEVRIANPMGFHVRPVQRFAEMARIFDCDVEVQVRGRTVPGKSVMNLMSLGGRFGDTMKVIARGVDARQCVAVLRYLTENCFFVEDSLDGGGDPLRHVQRFASIASCFQSRIIASLDNKNVDAKDQEALNTLGLTPTSEPEVEAAGEDARQAQALLMHMVEHCYFVEDQMAKKKTKAS